MLRRIGWALPGLAVLVLAALAPQGAGAATNRAASATCREYRCPPSSGGPAATSAATGTECAVKTSRASSRTSAGRLAAAEAERADAEAQAKDLAASAFKDDGPRE